MICFFSVEASGSPAALSDATWHTFFLVLVQWGYAKIAFVGWLQCLWDAVAWRRVASENKSLLAVFV